MTSASFRVIISTSNGRYVNIDSTFIFQHNIKVSLIAEDVSIACERSDSFNIIHLVKLVIWSNRFGCVIYFFRVWFSRSMKQMPSCMSYFKYMNTYKDNALLEWRYVLERKVLHLFVICRRECDNLVPRVWLYLMINIDSTYDCKINSGNVCRMQIVRALSSLYVTGNFGWV